MRQKGGGGGGPRGGERAVDNFLIFLESHWIHPLEQRGEIRAVGKQISFVRQNHADTRSPRFLCSSCEITNSILHFFFHSLPSLSFWSPRFIDYNEVENTIEGIATTKPTTSLFGSLSK